MDALAAVQAARAELHKSSYWPAAQRQKGANHLWQTDVNLAAAIVALTPPPTTPAESPDKTTVPPAAKIVDAGGHVWSIVNRQVAIDGKPDAVTSSVVKLIYFGKRIYQQNTPGDFYVTNATVPAVWSKTTDPLAPAPTLKVVITGTPAKGATLKGAIV